LLSVNTVVFFMRAIPHKMEKCIMTAQSTGQPNSQFGKSDEQDDSSCLPDTMKNRISLTDYEKQNGEVFVSIREICGDLSCSTEMNAYVNAVKDGLYIK